MSVKFPLSPYSNPPSNVIVHVVLVTGPSHVFLEGVVSPLFRICNVCPGSQWTVYSDAIIVDLISSTDPNTN